MFSSALLVSDPKATSRCLQSPGRAALSVRRAAEIPVCQFKWHSPSSSACIFRSTAKCGKQGTQLSPPERAYPRSQQARQHPQKTATQGGSFLLLSSFNMLPFFFFLLPAGLPARQHVMHEDSITGEESFHSSPSPPYCRCASFLQLCPGATACIPWPRPPF